MHVKLLCARCGAPLAPAYAGLRCPRLTACGRGGIVETLRVGSLPAPATSGAGVRA